MHHPKLATLCSLAGVLAAAAGAVAINAEVLSSSAPPTVTRELPVGSTTATTLPATTTLPAPTTVATTLPRPTTSPTTSSTTPPPSTRPDPPPSPTSTPQPAATGTLPERYTVVAGDCWSCIADRLGVDIDVLLAANGATVGVGLQPGQVIAVPVGGVLPHPDVPQSDSPPPAAGSSNQASYLLGLAGSAMFDRAGGVLRLVSVTPSQHWTVASSGNDGPTTVVIELTSTRGQTTRFTATLVRGVVVVTVSTEHDGPAGGDRPVGQAPSAPVTVPTQRTPPERPDDEGRSDDHASTDDRRGNDGDRGGRGGNGGDRGGRGGNGGGDDRSNRGN